MFTAGEPAGGRKHPNVCVCNVCVFQGFGETVELPDAAGLLPEPELRLQSPAGQLLSAGGS